MIHLLRALVLLCGSSVLCACSGGGGGGGGNPPANPPANPPPPPFAFTSLNAVDAAGFVLGGIEQTWLVAQYPPVIADFVTRTHQQEMTFRCDATTTFRFRHTDNDNNRAVSVGDVVKLEFPKCGAYTVDIALTVSAITFSNGSLTALTGSTTFELTMEPPSAVVIQSSALLAQATGFHMVGSFKLAYSGGPLGPSGVGAQSRRWQVTELAATITSGGTVETISNGTLDRSVDPSNDYSAAVSGSVDSERLGVKLGFSTTAPFKGKVGFFPTSGALLVTSGATSLLVTPTADALLGNDYADAAIDAAGAGFATPLHFQWLDFMRGGLFGWYPNSAPTITGLVILPTNPTKATDIFANYQISDRENDAVSVEIEWRRNGVLLADQSGYLQATNFARGDVMEVTVNASDLRGKTTRTATTTILNSVPRLEDVAITPSSPLTSDDLTVSATAVDLDGDALTVRYVWKRNDAVIAGQTGSTLPASATRAGDSITAVITASDGEAEVTAEANVPVMDTPASITVTSAPPASPYGAHVQFDADATDPDEPGEALTFELAYGPAGMTIDPATGEVAWDATPPMFDRTMDVHWGITVDAPGAPVVSGTITVNDTARQYPLMRTGIEIPIANAGLSIGDFDDDGDAEAMILSHRSLYELESDGAGGYRQAWMYPFTLGVDEDSYYPYSSSDMRAMVTGDADGDGKHEIYVAAGGSLFKLDGVERRVVASKAMGTPQTNCSDLVFANLDGGPESELVCLTSDTYNFFGMVVFGANGLAVRHEFPNTDYGSAFAVGNVDNDSALEIVTSGGYVFDGATFQNQWLYGPGFGNDVATGDLDGNGVAEIVAAVSWVALRTYSATLKTPLWEIPQSDLAVVIATNIDGDSADEILLGDGQWGSVTAYNYNAANNTATVIFSIDSQDHGVSAIGVGDLDHNDGGKLEFLWGTGASSSGADKLIVAGRNPAIEVEWTNTDPVQLDGPFVGGELAGTTTVADAPLYATAATDSGYAGSRLVRMDPTTGDLDVSKELGQLWQGVAALTVVDYDGDGVDEAFVGTGQFYDAYLTAYDVFQGAGGATEWTSPSLPQSQGVRTIVHSDLTGDGHDDLVAITSGGVVYVHDVFTQTLVWQSTTLGAGRDVVVADLDRDGSRDIIAVTQSGIYVYERVTGPLTYVQTATYSAQPYSEDFQDALIFDTDGDGELEVVALLLDSYIYDRASRLKRFDKSLAPLGDVQLAWRAETIVLEPSTAVRKNVLVPTQNWLGSPTEIVAVDVLTGGEAWRSPMLLGQIAKGSLHFVTIGGKRRITIGTGAGMYLTR